MKTIRYDNNTNLYHFIDLALILNLRNPSATYYAQIPDSEKGKVAVDNHLDSFEITLKGIYDYLEITRKNNVNEVHYALNSARQQQLVEAYQQGEVKRLTQKISLTAIAHPPLKLENLEELTAKLERLANIGVDKEVLNKLVGNLI